MKKDPRSSGFILIISSPSGCGKTTLAKLLLEEDDDLARSISITTRPKREGEEHSKDYFFIDEKTFNMMSDSGLFLEQAKVFNNFYATSKPYVEEFLEQGKDVVCVIDWQGGVNLMKSGKDTVSIFILPPSLKVLKARLSGRKTDSEEVINHRLAEAKNEISKCKYYDYIVVNDELGPCVEQLKTIINAERLKRSRQDLSQLISEIEKE